MYLSIGVFYSQYHVQPYSTDIAIKLMTLKMAWRTRPLQLIPSGGPVNPTPIREYNGLRGENRGPFKGQQASALYPVMS